MTLSFIFVNEVKTALSLLWICPYSLENKTEIWLESLTQTQWTSSHIWSNKIQFCWQLTSRRLYTRKQIQFCWQLTSRRLYTRKLLLLVTRQHSYLSKLCMKYCMLHFTNCLKVDHPVNIALSQVTKLSHVWSALGDVDQLTREQQEVI